MECVSKSVARDIASIGSILIIKMKQLYNFQRYHLLSQSDWAECGQKWDEAEKCIPAWQCCREKEKISKFDIIHQIPVDCPKGWHSIIASANPANNQQIELSLSFAHSKKM